MKAGIIGGGISGLTVAYYLQKMGISYDIFEQGEFPGGNIKSTITKNYVLEMGPNALHMTPELETLIRELKLEDEITEPKAEAGNRFILQHGHYQKLPETILQLISSNFFSWKTRYKIMQERFLEPQPADPLETVSHFIERRFNREVVEKAVEPLVMGLFGGDPEQLLIQKTFPQLVKFEAEYGSVLKGLMKSKAEGRRIFSFKNGLQTLPLVIASKLIELHTNAQVEMVTRSHGKFIISTSSPEYTSSEYDILVLALPAHRATSLLEFTFPGVAAALRNVNYPPACVVHSVYRRTDVKFPLKGFGALHPKTEHQFSVGSVWNSSVFEGRCYEDEVLFTTMIGGAKLKANAQKPRAEILKAVHEELQRNYQISAERPVFQHFYMWNHAIPQFDIFIEDAQELVKTLESENVFVASNWNSGISVPECVKQAAEVAKKIQALAASQTG
ncbi:protoporphyrinogen oxidase [Adhaeribacter sp. BT258]|uniref:Coproporphyrinogen III oxidase n=1 Tax=Adhaeribacter terrigena TaxID=2793070 RepID=A0ABS1BYE1_9BACT|nr:protoporphyrinogen oxidase [Adhaeribacter terrigena]MBK0402166.1 protoporphyrinogen oxidase [Adhaeribacter terrigena]